MACMYCDVKPPTRKRYYDYGADPVGVPLAHGDMGTIVIARSDYPGKPDRYNWTMTFWTHGTGLYTRIEHCPMCGRTLPMYKTERGGA